MLRLKVAGYELAAVILALLAFGGIVTGLQGSAPDLVLGLLFAFGARSAWRKGRRLRKEVGHERE